MTVNCSLTVTGIQPEQSVRAFMDSYRESSRLSRYENKESQLNNFFQEKMRESIVNNDINVTGLEDSFELNIRNNRIEFSTTMPDVANTFEYGSGNVQPRRYIQPVVAEVANQMSKNIINEAIGLYSTNTRITTVRR